MAGLWRLFTSSRRRSRDRGRASSHVSQPTWWEARWRKPDMQACFLGRPVSPEIVASVEDGWLPRGGHALDAGCGEGVVAAWLSQNGFTALGVDVAPSAIARARALHPETDRLRFSVGDLRREPPATPRPFDVVIDRGCFHQMRRRDLPAYTANLASACAADARMLIFYRAYRRGVPYGDSAERERLVERVQGFYRGLFDLERVADTWLDPVFGRDPKTAKGGITLWLRRVGG